MELKDRCVVITGATGNLGRAVAEAFAAAGAKLALVGHNPDSVEKLAAALPMDGHRGYAMDLTDPQAVNDGFAQIIGDFGRLDVLANIAGGFHMGPKLHETSDAEWDHMLDLNLRSVFHCCRAAVLQMLHQGAGRIVNVSARAALAGKAGMGAYCTSKAGVITLTESLSEELKLQGINVNCILPGTIDTPENRAGMPDADHSRWVAPAALAEVVRFLASDAARAVTGAAIPVYGIS